MLQWIAANLGTIIISLLLILIVVAIVICIKKDKKQGQSTCGGNCAGCAMCGSCHQK